jgi:uncharacterized membrane protein YgcG
MGIGPAHSGLFRRSKHLMRGVVVVSAIAVALPPPPAFAQPKPVAAAETSTSEFAVAQLDAMLAPIALYPDELLTQILIASTYPLQVVAASRWLERSDNKNLKGDALVNALEGESWDPSVKSLLPFPQIIAMLNAKVEWMQQLGYAFANQQDAVLDSVQRLRRQAQKAGSLKTTEQQRVVVEQNMVIIEPASCEIVYVPVYQPANVYGEWPYPETPPVYVPPPEAYYPAAYAPGYVWGTALTFAVGAAIVGGLWGWARPGWGYGNVTVNPLRYNNINVGRPPIQGGNWRPPGGGVGGRPIRPPGGPVGLPARPNQLPASAIGRGNVQVPGGAVNRPQIPSKAAGAQRPGGSQLGQRPGGGPSQQPSAGQRPAGQRAGALLPAGGQQRPGGSPGVIRGGGMASSRPPEAFGGMGDGARASQFASRGAQSRNLQQGAVAGRGGGGAPRGGGGASRGGGGRR